MAAKVQFGTGTTARDFGEYRRWLEAAEFAGFDLLTAGDSQTLWADCFSMLTVAATVTSRPRLALTVTNPQTRHPSVSAAAAASVAKANKKVTITCVKGKLTKKVSGAAPKCPAGYKKKS